MLLQDFDAGFPPLLLQSVSYYGGGIVETGMSIDVASPSGGQTCAFDLIEASRRLNNGWIDGPICDPIVPNFVEILQSNDICDLCDWSAGFPTSVAWRGDTRVVFLRFRAQVTQEWTYGWVAYEGILVANDTCDDECEGWGTSFARINFIAAGFETEPTRPIAPGVGTCEADLTFDGILDLADLQLFVESFVSTRTIADRNADGVYDLADVQAFVGAFVAGCS